MSKRSAAIKLTANFENNLAAIERFCDENDCPQTYDQLLEELAGTVLPNLERFPQIGQPLLTRPADSIEALSKQELLRTRLSRLGADSDIREYVAEHYLILYARINEVVHLLSIRHHKQLSFDLLGLWRPRDED